MGIPILTKKQTLELTSAGHKGPPSTRVLFYGGTVAHMWIQSTLSLQLQTFTDLTAADFRPASLELSLALSIFKMLSGGGLLSSHSSMDSKMISEITKHCTLQLCIICACYNSALFVLLYYLFLSMTNAVHKYHTVWCSSCV